MEKPFGCPQPGCGMSFTNEDHLTVHKRYHENSYVVLPSLVKSSTILIDQTPTPTRFLKQSEEEGLFHEVNLNPFDEQFRKASQYQSASIHHREISNSSPSGSLETPRIIAPVDSDETISSTSRDEPHPNGGIPILFNNISSTQHQTNSNSVPKSRDNAIDLEERQSSRIDGKHRLHVNISSAAEVINQTSSNIISTPTPVITAGPSVTQSLNSSGIVCSNESTVITELKTANIKVNTPIAPAPTPTASAVPQSPSATVLELLLRLPNGQSIPVEIPAIPVASSASAIVSNANSINSHSNQYDQDTTQNPSLAKIKLKEALASSCTAARPGHNRNSRANTADRIAEMTRQKYYSGNSSSNEGDYPEDFNESKSNPNPIRKRRSSASDDDPMEKRRKFLERNRAAAIRCREKKKRWVQDLAYKSDELGAVNQRLQSEVSTLKSEVATLKSMLLKHKDCPVTLAMLDGSTPDPNDLMPLPPGQQVLAKFRKNIPPQVQKPRTRSLSLPAISASTSNSNSSSPNHHFNNDPRPSNDVAVITNVAATKAPIGCVKSVPSTTSVVVPVGSMIKVIPQQRNSANTVSNPAKLIVGSPNNILQFRTLVPISESENDSELKLQYTRPSMSSPGNDIPNDASVISSQT